MCTRHHHLVLCYKNYNQTFLGLLSPSDLSLDASSENVHKSMQTLIILHTALKKMCQIHEILSNGTSVYQCSLHHSSFIHSLSIICSEKSTFLFLYLWASEFPGWVGWFANALGKNSTSYLSHPPPFPTHLLSGLHLGKYISIGQCLTAYLKFLNIF